MTQHFFTRSNAVGRLWLVWLLAASSFWGCVRPQQLVYFQKKAADRDTLAIVSRKAASVRPGDILSVQVSSLNPEASNFFNPFTAQAATDRLQYQFSGTNPLPYATGYLVDEEGEIEMPLIGKVAVAGKTTKQVGDQVRERLRTYLKEPTVNVRNQSFRISVLGEVERPSLFTIPNEQITLPEALGLAGDVTIYGERKNVLVVREEDGQRIFARVDLTGRDLFTSPFYYLRPNDIVYVEPGKARVASADRLFLLVPALLSALSFIAIIVQQTN